MKKRTVLGIGAACVIGAASAAAISMASDRYGLAHEVQKYYSCLPHSLYLVDYQPDSIERGDLVQVEAPEGDDKFRSGFPLMKIVVGMPGDQIEVVDDRVYVNGTFWAELFMRESLGKPHGYFDRAFEIKAGEYAVMGVTPSSYDSRYWGPIKEEAIHGTATVIL